MKKVLTFIYIVMAVMAAQSQVVTLKFVGADRTGQDYVRLHHVSVYDHDQLWHQVIYYPDTTLALYQNGTVGIVETMCTSSLQLAQNTPNPFTGTTDVNLTTADAGDVTLEIVDGNGKIVGTHRVRPEIGTHQFRISLNAAGTYVMTARQNGKTSSIKMVCNGGGGGNSITHVGTIGSDGTITLFLKNGMSDGSYPFRLGDRMEFIGYAMIDETERVSETVNCNQGNFSNYTLRFDVARPEVATLAATDITAHNATFHGEVTADNNAFVTERGFCWVAGDGTPTLANDHLTVGDGLGSFDVEARFIASLQPATTYLVRAYAVNAVGISYGETKAFTTNDTLPEVTTTQPTDVTITSFICGGDVVTMNSATLTARGVCWNTTGNPTVADSHTTDGAAAGSFTSSVTGLVCGTTYYVRAYATNSAGTGYGEEFTVTTIEHGFPDVVTLSVAVYNISNVIVNSEVIDDNCDAVTIRGICYSTSHNPTISELHTSHSAGLGNFSDTITGLALGTTYYVRAYATNGVGTSYGEELIVTTPTLPAVTTTPVTSTTTTTALCGGNVTFDGGATITARGVCWSTSQNPTISGNHTLDGNAAGIFTSSITGLAAVTTYYVRAYATNCVGTSYGEEVLVTTPLYVDGDPCLGTPTLTDCEGNTYNTVIIGTQCWMKENLRTTKYADNTSIAQGSENSTTTAYWYYPNADASNKPIYGLLYNWKAVMRTSSSSITNPSGVQGICPTGWHVPSDAEWKQMEMTVGMSQSDADNTGWRGNIAARLCGNTGWTFSSDANAPGNTSATGRNSSGFSALPAGDNSVESVYNGFGGNANFWSSTESSSTYAYFRSLFNGYAGVARSTGSKYIGYSVRCVKDETQVGGTETTIPTVTTVAVRDVTDSSATCGGNVTSDGSATITARGVCWSTTPNPTISDNHTTDGSSFGIFTSSITGLTVGTTYYVRAYATNSVGTAYGSVVSFIAIQGAPCPGTFTLTDVDGNIYNTVQIGQQCWMKENLRTTKYADNTSIEQGSSASSTTAYWYYPNNDASNKPTYGLLYNWPAMMGNSSPSSSSGGQGICPMGWHVPSNKEWRQLIDYVSSQSQYVCGSNNNNIAKALADTTCWSSSTNTCAIGNTPSNNNATGFSALPAGSYYWGTYSGVGSGTLFWCATTTSHSNLVNVCYYILSCDTAGMTFDQYEAGYDFSFSVRCVKD